jgi:hypothetical protein
MPRVVYCIIENIVTLILDPATSPNQCQVLINLATTQS